MDKTYFKSYINTIPKVIKLSHKNLKVGTHFNEVISRFLVTKIPNDNEKKTFPIEVYNVINSINEYWRDTISGKFQKQEIIYEIVKDENGWDYAKEIYTGCLFPITGIGDFEINYEATAIIEKRSSLYQAATDYYVDIKTKYKYKNPCFDNLEVFIWSYNSHKVAAEKEIKEYLKQFETKSLFGKKINDDNIDKLKELSKLNTLKSNIVMNDGSIIESEQTVTENTMTKNIEQESQNPATIVMENIEFLLMQIGKIDVDLKRAMTEEYNILLQNEDAVLTLSPLTLESLKAFEAKLEFIINFQKKKDDNIISCLDNMIVEYENDEDNCTTLENIEKLISLFLKMKNTYSLTMQRKVIEKFALLYIYAIHKNKDSITINELSNSYFNSILKSIIIYLNEMMDNNIIENNIIISTENINPTYVLDLIKQIKFVQKEKGNQKKIGDVNE